jgi:hypothetical protein
VDGRWQIRSTAWSWCTMPYRRGPSGLVLASRGVIKTRLGALFSRRKVGLIARRILQSLIF